MVNLAPEPQRPSVSRTCFSGVATASWRTPKSSSASPPRAEKVISAISGAAPAAGEDGARVCIAAAKPVAPVRVVALAAGLTLVLGLAGCENSAGHAYASRVAAPEQLIGGPGALGAIGDYVLGNQKIKVIIQDKGWSRGFGIFGGGILDADLVRPGAAGGGAAPSGRDNFGEFFPTLFLEAFDVDDIDTAEGRLAGIEVINDGRDGKPALIRTRARGGHFLTLVATLLELGLPSELRFETDYILSPGARHIEIRGRVINAADRAVHIPDRALAPLLSRFGVPAFETPLGDIALFGGGNAVFAPGQVDLGDGRPPRPAGFNLRFAVEDAYALDRQLPALQGLVTDLLATAGDDVSYGIAVADSPNNYVWKNRREYGRNPQAPLSQHAMLVPFLISSFTGVFYELPPAQLEPGESYEYTKYFIIGDGDVGSVRAELYRIRGTAVGHFLGTVADQLSGQPIAGAWVHIADQRGAPYSQVTCDAEGRFRTSLQPGTYSYTVTSPGRRPYPDAEGQAAGVGRFTVKGVGREVYRRIALPGTGTLKVQARGEDGQPLPAKVSIVGDYQVSDACQTCMASDCTAVCAPRNSLFDFSLAERRRPTNLAWRNAAGNRDGQFVEDVFFLDGTAAGASHKVRPSRCDTEGRCAPYDIHVSRGPEYDAQVFTDITIVPGQMVELAAVLRRSVDTTDFIAADLHVHAQGSVDSSIGLDTRVLSAAAEGIEMLVATDHNVVTDYRPAILRNGLQDWLGSMIGVELSTLEMGHFNAFPLQFDKRSPSHFPFVSACFAADAGKANGTAFDWVQCDPQTLFTNLRSLGSHGPENTIIQVNHPRDQVLGYFNQYFVNPYSLEPEVPSSANFPQVDIFYPRNDETGQWQAERFSWDFDALEVFNGKNMNQLHDFRTPETAPAGYLAEIRDYQCGTGHPFNEPGEPLLRNGGHVAYPGVVNDWLRLLNRGFTFTATGNSDSHGVASEVGFPRTYLHLPANGKLRRDLSPGAVSDLDVVRALREHRALVSNGPFLSMAVVTDNSAGSSSIVWPVGSTVLFAEPHTDRDVQVLLTIKSANWLTVDVVRVWANGRVIDELVVPAGTGADGRDMDDDNAFRRTYTFDQDVVLVAEAMAGQNMFPYVTPSENPPANVDGAIDAILSGVDGEDSSASLAPGIDRPDPVEIVTPYALTNPIWLDIDADGDFDPPGNNRGPGPAPVLALGLCDRDFRCPAGQVCDQGAVPPACMCETDAVNTSTQPASLLHAPLGDGAQAGRRFHSWDIRKVFIGHEH